MARRGRRKGSRDNEKDLYEILGVSRTATIPEIKNSYRKLVEKYHPDRARKKSPAIQKRMMKKMQIINHAKDILLDLTSRSMYDYRQGWGNVVEVEEEEMEEVEPLLDNEIILPEEFAEGNKTDLGNAGEEADELEGVEWKDEECGLLVGEGDVHDDGEGDVHDDDNVDEHEEDEHDDTPPTRHEVTALVEVSKIDGAPSLSRSTALVIRSSAREQLERNGFIRLEELVDKETYDEILSGVDVQGAGEGVDSNYTLFEDPNISIRVTAVGVKVGTESSGDDAELKVEPEVESEVEPEVEPEAESEVESEEEPEAELKVESEDEPEAELEAELEGN